MYVGFYFGASIKWAKNWFQISRCAKRGHKHFFLSLVFFSLVSPALWLWLWLWRQTGVALPSSPFSGCFSLSLPPTFLPSFQRCHKTVIDLLGLFLYPLYRSTLGTAYNVGIFVHIRCCCYGLHNTVESDIRITGYRDHMLIRIKTSCTKPN